MCVNKCFWRNIGRGAASIFLSVVLAFNLPAMALAYDISAGSITITATGTADSPSHNVDQGDTHDTGVEHPEITGSSETNTVTISALENTTASVTFNDVNINANAGAAVSTSGSGNVVIELDGSNSLQSGVQHAGLEKGNNGNLTITDTDGTRAGSLNTTGGTNGAGIGGGYQGTGSDITITGSASVIAAGGTNGAGIGGGYQGTGSDITITGSASVIAAGGTNGAGIGGGNYGAGSNITITGNADVTASGTVAAGIGGGNSGNGYDITINGNASVTASSDNNGAGIGGGNQGSGSNIIISGDANVTATGGTTGAGIGGGNGSTNGASGSYITISGNATVTTTGGDCGAGIGGGHKGAGSDITITDNANVTATGGDCGAGIGGGHIGAGSDIAIFGDSTVTAIGGPAATGIGGGNQGNGSGINIGGNSTVIATGGESAAGIGGGAYTGIGSDISISGNADVYAAGGTRSSDWNYGSGPAIGSGADYHGNNGAAVDVDTSELVGGSINTYAPGTTAAQIQRIISNPVNPGPAVPEEAEMQPEVAGIAPNINSNSEFETVSPLDTDAAFFAAVEMQIDDLLKEISSLIAEGKINEAKALILKGLTINAGTHRGFNAATLAKIGQASSAGIAITVNFSNAGNAYSVTIPGNSSIDPATLVDESGYCEFTKLLNYF